MTTRPSASAPPTGQFPEFPPRDDMQNTLHLHDQAHQAALRLHLGNPDTTVVIGEVPIGWNIHTRREIIRVPDLLIAFNVDRALVIAEMGYSIAEHGKAPDFALEIASPNTARNDEAGKRIDYANFGVREYWRFDASGGRWYQQPLAGDTLVATEYRTIEIHRVDDDRHWGHSAVLNLDVCWEYGEMRFYDPAANRYLLTYDETETALHNERAAHLLEREAYLAKREAYLAERDARLAAEARIRQLEAENQRLRNQ